MTANKIDDTLTELDFKSLYHCAEWHDKQATILRARAQKLQERDDMQNAVALRQQFLRRLPKTIIRYLKQGHTAERALELTASYTDTPINTVSRRWKDFLQDNTEKNRKFIHAKVYELHGLGLSNKNIAERFDLHHVTVSRILKAQREKRLYNPNPNKIELFLDHTKDQSVPKTRQLRVQ